MSALFIVMIVSGLFYLVCDWIESAKLSAFQELARIIFATSSLAFFLAGGLK